MTTLCPPTNRRRHERFATLPMYTAVQVWPAGQSSNQSADTAPPLEGHAYDLSEGGIRFELDAPIPPGTAITLRLQMPRWLSWRSGAAILDAAGTEPTCIEVLARVLWIDDDGVRGPVRMAAVFTSFLDASDKDRLMGMLTTGGLRRAA